MKEIIILNGNFPQIQKKFQSRNKLKENPIYSRKKSKSIPDIRAMHAAPELQPTEVIIHIAFGSAKQHFTIKYSGFVI